MAVVSRSDVLIVSSDPVVAALLGASVELAGFSPTFAGEGERLEAELQRTHPGVVLVDGEDVRLSEHDAQVARAAGARLLLFSRRAIRGAVESTAAKMGARAFTMPMAPGELAQLLANPE